MNFDNASSKCQDHMMEMSPAPPIHESDGGDSFGVPSPMPVSPPTQLRHEECMSSGEQRSASPEQFSHQVEETSLQHGMEQNKECKSYRLNW